MRRALIAAAWLLGTTVPALLSVVFFFGCCVLPFHHVVHHLMPLCSVARQMLAPAHDEAGTNPDVTPPRAAKQAPRPVLLLARTNAFERLTAQPRSNPASTAIGYRSFISLGATRCDADVGSRLILLDTFRI